MRALAVLVVLAFLSVPALAAAPPSCVPTCSVLSSAAGYDPAAIVVSSGSTVTWSGIPVENVAHTATEEGVTPASACFAVFYVPNSGPATFTIHDGALWAQQPLKTEKRCTTAVALPGGSFALRFYCQYHPNTMQGVLVVRP